MTFYDEVSADSPDLWWKLEDLSGATVVDDASGNNLDGSIWGTINPGFEQAAIFSGLGTSVGLNGTGNNNYLYRAYDSSLNVGTGDFCYEFVIICNNNTSNYVEIYGRDTGASGNGFIIYLQIGTGAFRIWCGGSVLVGTTRISDGLPHYVVISRTSGVLKIYVDNILDASDTLAGNTDSSSPSITLGVATAAYATFNGTIGQFIFYNTGLTVERIAAHALALGILPPVPLEQQGSGYIYENIGFNAVNTQEADGFIYENVGFNTENSKEGSGFIYQDVISEVTPPPSYWGHRIK